MNQARLEPKIDGYYENTLTEVPLRPPRKFLNPSFNTSNSLFAQENEPLEVRLMSRFEKMNQTSMPHDSTQLRPNWFDDQFELLNELGKIQLEQVKYPTVAELGSNIIRNDLAINPPVSDISLSQTNDLRNILSNIISPKLI